MTTPSDIMPLLTKAFSGEALNSSELNVLTSRVRNSDSAPVQRSELLPLLFKIQGKPYALDDYPQFRAMYDNRSQDVLFLCGRQVSKSSNFSRSEVLSCVQQPHYRILYVAPLEAQAHDYSAQYLQEAIATCEYAKLLQDMTQTVGEAGAVKRSVTRQSFGNGSSIRLTYAKTSPDRSRGIPADQIDFDEIQDQLVDALPIISQSLTQSEYGFRRFAGTAKTVDNTIEYLWQESSMGEWVTKCDHCNYWNIPNLDGKIMEMIQAEGPCCVKCGKRLNVRAGHFVHAHPERVPLFAGYHVPQIVVPAIAETPAKWHRLLLKVLRQPLSVVQQEILGISCSTGARLITQTDIDKASVLPPVKALYDRIGDYPLIISGVDWGIAEVTSFTVHVIIGMNRDGYVHVLWAKRFSGFDPDEVLRQIAQAHRYYGGHILAADFGMGFDKNVMLSNRFGLPVIQIQYVRQGQMLQLRPILGYPRWTVDKTTALETLFFAIKYGKVLFPPKQEFDVYTRDLLSPYEEISTESGLEYRRFVRNPSVPDDFAHALCFAFMAALKSTGASIVDAVPAAGFGGALTDIVLPPIDTLDPTEILRGTMG